jgi:hypothetical protein
LTPAIDNGNAYGSPLRKNLKDTVGIVIGEWGFGIDLGLGLGIHGFAIGGSGLWI